MKKYLSQYREYIKGLLEQNEVADKEKVLSYHKSQIVFFQHERFIHLIITLFFSLILIASVISAYLTSSVLLTILSALLLCLVVPYIMHYYFLENNVQGLYDDYNRLYDKFYGISYNNHDQNGSRNE